MIEIKHVPEFKDLPCGTSQRIRRLVHELLETNRLSILLRFSLFYFLWLSCAWRLHPGTKKARKGNVGTSVEWRLNSENDSRLHGQPSFDFILMTTSNTRNER
jgi:hypothetical protein